MLNKKVEEILVSQIGKELYSSNLYLAMASWAEVSGLEGTSKWFYAQADEERMHMLKFIEYVNERGGTAIQGSVLPLSLGKRGDRGVSSGRRVRGK